MRRVLEIFAIAVGSSILLVALGFYGWTRFSRYPAFDYATSLAEEAQNVEGWVVLEPEGEPVAGFVFYPGGLVDPAAYAPLMQRVSDGGVLAVIVPMPLDLAVFDIRRADEVIAAYPEVERWAIGGHSLGGAMACEYVAAHPEVFDGLVLLASYPAESTDLSATDVQTVLIYGTEDGVSGDVFEDSVARLPADTVLVEISGGNHAQFGDYGPQEGDGTASVSRDQQQRLSAESILVLLGSLE
ncbi:alpha/beta fold hydrolase [Candidatus Bipolaricaulota bacterium]|nr:alpha/beta fold hydrolase [Candidatus Bipolaricaulota bacterium]